MTSLTWCTRVVTKRAALQAAAACTLALAGLGAGAPRALSTEAFATQDGARPDYVRKLEASFGAPSQAGFGSTVLSASIANAGVLEDVALAAYRHFTGKLWQEWGESAWMSAWKPVHRRAGVRNIVAELRGLEGPLARSNAEMILDATPNPIAGQEALSAAFDDTSVEELMIFAIGDGAAMSGLLVAARRTGGDAVFLVFLMD